MVIELERTFLLKKIPPDLQDFPFKELLDIYIPTASMHPVLRIRKDGDRYELTKKIPKSADITEYTEATVPLTKEEFVELSQIPGKRIRKIRYAYKIGEQKAEIDVFQDSLKGLILIDFEFRTVRQKNTFVPPDCCLVEISHEPSLGGGYLAGKRYIDIENILDSYKYKRLLI